MTPDSSAERETPDSISSSKGDAPSPRAFVVGTGFVCQSVGLVFAFGVCCFWSLTTYFVPPEAGSHEHWMDNLTGDRLAAALVSIGVAVSLVGGLGLIGAGVGLQGEQSNSGRVAMAVTGVVGLTYWVLCALFVFKTDSWSGCVISAVFAATTTALFGLATHSATVLRRFPPPPDQNVVTDEFLERHRHGRRMHD